MKVVYNSMTIFIKEDYEAMSKKAANMVAGQINIKPNSVIGLATGSTPEGMYRELVALHQKDSVDFSDVTTFNLDEYNRLPADNEQSYAFYMEKNLFSQVNISEKNVHVPNGSSDDVVEVCTTYDRMIEDHNNMDLQILGIGNNGHIGFNEPDVKFEAGTHLVRLDEDTIEANARFFPTAADVPREAISMGIRNIMHAKKVVLIANGTNKSEVLKEMIFGPVTPNLPASVLQLHNDVTLVLEREAAGLVVEELKVRGVIQ